LFRHLACLAFSLSVIGSASSVWAWGDLGHRVICQIAFQELNEKARNEVILLAELSASAKKLNRESDSLNDLIERLEATLQKINVGIEVWLDRAPLESETIEDEAPNDDELYEKEIEERQLGFTKLNSGWRLAVRTVTDKYLHDRFGNIETNSRQLRTADEVELASCSRDIRINALKRFPQLVAKMKQEADTALEASERAKKFTK